jgi:hypothetical protein
MKNPSYNCNAGFEGDDSWASFRYVESLFNGVTHGLQDEVPYLEDWSPNQDIAASEGDEPGVITLNLGLIGLEHPWNLASGLGMDVTAQQSVPPGTNAVAWEYIDRSGMWSQYSGHEDDQDWCDGETLWGSLDGLTDTQGVKDNHYINASGWVTELPAFAAYNRIEVGLLWMHADGNAVWEFNHSRCDAMFLPGTECARNVLLWPTPTANPPTPSPAPQAPCTDQSGRNIESYAPNISVESFRPARMICEGTPIPLPTADYPIKRLMTPASGGFLATPSSLRTGTPRPVPWPTFTPLAAPP